MRRLVGSIIWWGVWWGVYQYILPWGQGYWAIGNVLLIVSTCSVVANVIRLLFGSRPAPPPFPTTPPRRVRRVILEEEERYE